MNFLIFYFVFIVIDEYIKKHCVILFIAFNIKKINYVTLTYNQNCRQTRARLNEKNIYNHFTNSIKLFKCFYILLFSYSSERRVDFNYWHIFFNYRQYTKYTVYIFVKEKFTPFMLTKKIMLFTENIKAAKAAKLKIPSIRP